MPAVAATCRKAKQGAIPILTYSTQAPGRDRRVGITTTLPIEPVLAAGLVPVDLNNLFIGSGRSRELIELAEREGFPRNSCSWIKGIYGAVMEAGISVVVGVSNGDCDSGRALCEVLSSRGVRILDFSFPFSPDARALRLAVMGLCSQLGVGYEEAETVFEELREARSAALEVDHRSWRGGDATELRASEVADTLVSTSDFGGDHREHLRGSQELLSRYFAAGGESKKLRLALLGVPPIMTDLYDILEALGARVVFHEVPYQFALPSVRSGADLAHAYSGYTYPYGMAYRLRAVREELEERGVDGVLHYVQTFCHRQIEDILVHEGLDLPVLTLEGDSPAPVDARTKLRLEAFVAGLARGKRVRAGA